MVDEEVFQRQAEPFRKELLAHCYRMLGSVHDAEDLVQETYLRAWRSYDAFEERSSLRTWLYRIATRVCLTALQGQHRRPLPTGFAEPGTDPTGNLAQRPEVPWLEPIPSDPATIVTSRESIRLAFVAALQHLPPRQRAVLILRDVLKWRAAEVADLLGTTTAAVNSALQRAHAQLDEAAPSQDKVVEPTARAQRELLDRYVRAFEDRDVAGIVKLFTTDAVWEMPPFTSWFQGPVHIGRLIETHAPFTDPGDFRLVPAEANAQPAYAMYLRDADGIHQAFSLQVLTITEAGIAHVVNFHDPGLVTMFGLSKAMDPRTSR